MKAIDLSSANIFFPSYEIAGEERKVWVLYLYPEYWFQKKQRLVLATEVATPDERLWKDRETFNRVVLRNFSAFVLLLFFVEMYKYGITNYDDMIPYWEDFVHAPDWIAFCNGILKTRKSKEWWEKIKPQLEELKRIEWDELKAGDKVIGKIHFAFAEHKEKIEEIDQDLWDIARVNAFSKAREVFGEGENLKKCWEFVWEMVDEHKRRLK